MSNGKPEVAARHTLRNPTMHVGFIITAPYQLFHYARIHRFLGETTAFVEVRDEDFGITPELVQKHLPGARIRWITTKKLSKIDGACDVLVCQTPVPVLRFFKRSRIVAQQYSLAKERYQYGVWRAQADLNLMYGPQSVDRVLPFSYATAVGNPILDDFFSGLPSGNTPAAPARKSGRLNVLYMPTYGDLSNRKKVVRHLLRENIELSAKAHHADFEIARLAGKHSIPLHLSDEDPIELIDACDLVVSDYSGAIYDALALRKPVLVVDALNRSSKHIQRLSEEDKGHESVAALATLWTPGEDLHEAYAKAIASLASDESYRSFLDTHYTNLGSAGRACAEAMAALCEGKTDERFEVQQVGHTLKDYIEKNRTLTKKLKRRKGFVRLWLRSLRAFALKLARYLVSVLPGGRAVVDNLRRSRDAVSEWRAERRNPDQPQLPPTPHQRRRATLEIVRKALLAKDVEFRNELTASRAYCAIREEALPKVFDALKEIEETAGLTGFVVRPIQGSNIRRRAIPTAELELAHLVNSDAFTVGVPFRKSLYSIDRGGSVEFLILEPRDTRLVAKYWRTEKVDWTENFLSPAELAPARTAPAVVRHQPHALEGEPVDIVYTWVDSSDLRWRAERDRWGERQTAELQSADNEERYLNRNELCYSLRSIFMYAPFIRNIYIVTADQKPEWLSLRDDRIRLVSHSDIFPDTSDLPTFNSHAIESCLHRIPGLAEHFIYFNDDVFLGREVNVETFYTRAGLIKSRFSPSQFTALAEPDETAIPTDWASWNAVRLMLDDFGLLFDRKMKHVPMPLKRSLMEEIEDRYPDVVRQTRSNRFRSKTDVSIPSMLAHFYGVATGRAVEWQNVPGEYVYADTGRSDFARKLRAISRRKPIFLCLNVTRHEDIPSDKQASMLIDFMKRRFPIPSPYEMEKTHEYDPQPSSDALTDTQTSSAPYTRGEDRTGTAG